MSRKEREELRLISEGITLKLPETEDQKGKLNMVYPLLKDPNLLGDNGNVAKGMASKLEERLIRTNKLEEYNTQLLNYLDRGVIGEISREELDSWSGPFNYISHHGVEKLSSTTTKLRVVSNSSLKNNGLSYNDLLPKGPNSLTPLIEALTTFRSYKHVVSWDLKKAYNTIETGDSEKHMRRLVW